MSETLGRYTLVRRVGAGGMAEIWKAVVLGPQGFEKVLAIKKVLPEIAEDQSFLDMFIQEAKLVAQLVHPNIVQVVDFGSVGTDYYIAMEYVPGVNLARLLKQLVRKKLRLSPDIAIYVGIEVAKGLGYAHAKADSHARPLGIVHRDCTPHNILLSFGGEVKIADFGIAKVSSAKTRTSAGQIRGKLAYMSPEQALAMPIDGRCDLFALGVTLYELTTGVRLFHAPNEQEVYARVAGFEGLTAQQRDLVPENLRAIVDKALKPRPADRYLDAREMEMELAALLPPEAAIRARDTLAKLMQSVFAADWEQEKTGDNVRAVAPQSPPDLGPTARKEGALDVQASTRMVKTPTGINVVPRSRSWLGLAVGAVLGLIVALIAIPLVRTNVGGGATPTSTATPFAFGVTTANVPPTSTRSAGTATPLAHPSPARTHLASVPSPAPRHTPTLAAATPVASSPGLLYVTAMPWAEVWIDGKLVAKQTPLRDYSLGAGPHVLRLVNPPLNAEVKKEITVVSDRRLKLFVDLATRTVEIDAPTSQK